MSLVPFCFKCSFSEQSLKDLKNSTKGEYLESKKYTVSSFPDVEYRIRIYPNGKERGSATISFNVTCKETIILEKYVNFSVESAGCNYVCRSYAVPDDAAAGWAELKNLKRSSGFEKSDYSLKDFFNKKRRFISDGECVIKFEGWLELFDHETSKVKEIGLEHYSKLWKGRYADFTIYVGPEEIRAHRDVLASQSPVFQAIFDKKKDLVIPKKYPRKVVESAIKACYGIKFDSEASLMTLFSVLDFAGEYKIASVKDFLERQLIVKIEASNAVEAIKLANKFKADTIREKALEYIAECLKNEIFVTDLELLLEYICDFFSV